LLASRPGKEYDVLGILVAGMQAMERESALSYLVFVEIRALGRIQGALREPTDLFKADLFNKSAMAGRDEELIAQVRSRGHFATHPLWGDLDCYQWPMSIPSHCERHRTQMEECRPA
jgi:hypothetical protein